MDGGASTGRMERLRLKQTHYSNVQGVGSMHRYNMNVCDFSSENTGEVLRLFVAGRGDQWLR